MTLTVTSAKINSVGSNAPSLIKLGVSRVNLVIYVNDNFEEEKALYNLDSKQVIVKGDYYHDKIDSVIEGYLLAKCIDSDSVEDIWIDQNHEMFKELEFY